MNKRTLIFSLPLISLLLILLVFIGKYHHQEVIHIALAGPLQHASGQAMKQGVKLYLDQINQQGGIEGRPVKLQLFDDQDNQDNAAAVANKIIASDALAVIGHYSSEPSLMAARVYQQSGISAITGSATADQITQQNDWYFRVTFNNSDQGALLAHYVRKVLNYKGSYIFFDQDAYGRTLRQAFIETAHKIDLKICNQWSFNRTVNNKKAEYSFENQLMHLIEDIQNESEPCDEQQGQGMLFLAVHSTEAVDAVARIRRFLGRTDQKLPIIGADALSSSKFIHDFERYPQEEIYPGYYTNGIYTTSPFLVEFAGKRAQRFRDQFIKATAKADESLIMTAALYYDVAQVVVNAIQKMLKNKQVATLKAQRQQVRDEIQRLSRLEQALEGVTGALFFDHHGDVIRPILIGVYNHGKPIVASYQYQPLTDLRYIDNLLQEVLENRIIKVNNRFMQIINVVYVGIDFNNIGEFNIEKAIYTADFYLWFRSKTDIQYQDINFINISDPETNWLMDSSVLERREADMITKVYRKKAQFKFDLDLHNYPLDKQILPIRFRHHHLTTDKLTYVIDIQGMDIDDDVNTIESIFSVRGWKINHVSIYQNNQRNSSTLGLASAFNSQQRLEYSQFNFELEIERHVFSFILKNLLPVIFVVALGYATYFTHEFFIQMAVSTNMILSTSMFHLKLASSALANVDYNVLIEYVFYTVYLMAVFSIAIALILDAKNKELIELKHELEKTKASEDNAFPKVEHIRMKLAKEKTFIQRLMWGGRIGYPLLLFITVVVIFYSAL